MSNVEHNQDAGLAEFTAGWRAVFEDNEWITIKFAVVGLTNYGDKPVPSTRLAEILDRSRERGGRAGAAVGRDRMSGLLNLDN